jgi:signal peptidase
MLSKGVLLLILTAALVYCLCLLATAGLGWRIGAVASGSMAPALDPGEMAIARPVEPEGISQGDIIIFRAPEDSETVIIHRVTGILNNEGTLSFQTKGDANHGPDLFIVPAENVEGKLFLNMPYLGYLIEFLYSQSGLATLLGLSCAVAFLALTRRLGKPHLPALGKRRPHTNPATA